MKEISENDDRTEYQTRKLLLNKKGVVLIVCIEEEDKEDVSDPVIIEPPERNLPLQVFF